jgi:hypothetical protein
VEILYFSAVFSTLSTLETTATLPRFDGAAAARVVDAF